MTDTLICPVCGKEFIPKYLHNQKYCGEECRKIAKKKKDKEYYKNYYIEGKRVRPKKKEPLFGSRAQVKSKSLDSLSGEELLNYGKLQVQENIEQLRVHKE